MKRGIRKQWLALSCAMLLCACGQKNAESDAGNTPEQSEVIAIDTAHFPDEAFRTYLSIYADENKDGQLEYKEIEAIRGLGNVGRTGGLDDWFYRGEENETRERMLKAIESMEGIQYLWNLLEIRFEGDYALKVLPLDNPRLTDVWVTVDALEKFQIADGTKLQTFCYQACEDETIPWEDIAGLRRLELYNVTLDMTRILQNTQLKTLKLSDCEVSAPECVDFSVLPELTEFVYSVQGWQEDVLATELHLENNEKLVTVTVDESVAERIYLQDYGVECRIVGNKGTCEVQYTDMTEPNTSRELPEGSIWLSKENFPDEAFWRYLYYYVDENQDYILTQEERNAVYVLGEIMYEEWTSEHLERVAVLRKVQDFEGIQYLENLQEIVFSDDYAVQRLVLNHPKLQRLEVYRWLELQEFSIKNAESLTYLCVNVADTAEIDWQSMKQLEEVYFVSGNQTAVDITDFKNLRVFWLTNVVFDFAKLAQNESLKQLVLRECVPEKSLEVLDLSALDLLKYVEITITELPESHWFESICFGSGFGNAEEHSNILLTGGIAGKVYAENKGANVNFDGASCEVVYEDELPENMTAELPQGAIWNAPEYIADFNLRCALFYECDENRDNILTTEEREKFKELFDDGYDYSAGIDMNEHEWKAEDDISWTKRNITSLEGLQYFTELTQIQLETMELSEDVKEIVITNPKLEIFDLRLNANVELIDLRACEALRICVIDTTRDKDFIQEISPTILLPEHLEFYTVEGMDCVIGEAALERFAE